MAPKSPQKARIPRAAAELFAEHGYHGTGMAQLEPAVGLQRGALYHHIGHKEALPAEVGLVNRLVPAGTALEAALDLAAKVASAGPLAVAATKRIARSSADWTLAEGWEEQERIIAPVFVSEDAREGAAAFAEKRGPVWSGR
ncbi:enoyl-CoA hydratase-related protein [Streptomyces sp. NPDC060027]|uniref:enoyl-CoA hydratase-related protein n=1 Tax=Streptomyces sp. NPDC060027 TaxID=3347040 RepID=UPI0036B758C5